MTDREPRRGASRAEIDGALRRAGGNRAEAARLLGVGRATLYRWLDAQAIDGGEGASPIGGRYELLRPLGSGGQATVFLVRDRAAAGRGEPAERALKLLHAEAGEPDEVERLRGEFRALAALRHPGLVRVFDFGVDETSRRPYLVMEVVPGAPFLQAAAERPVGWVLAALAAALRAVAHLHRRGIVHRDLKPENVLVAPGSSLQRPGRVTVMDLGLSERLAGPQLGAGGTLRYAAPELLAGERASARSDVFALGVTLAAALEGRTAEQPAGLDALVARMTADDPAARCADAAVALEELERIAGPLPDAEAAPAGAAVAFVGRARELAEALARLEPRPESATPPFLLVAGDAGVGKSRLLETALDELRAQGHAVARGACRPGGEHSLDPVVEILAEVLGGADGSGQTPGDTLARRHRAALAAVAPALVKPEPGAAPPERRAALAALAELVTEAAAARPLVVALEDLHDADPFVLDLLAAIARRARGAALRVAATARLSEDRPAFAAAARALEAEGLFSALLLGPLAPDEVAALAAEIVGPARAALVSERVHALTSGNAFFTETVLRDLAERSPGAADALALPPSRQAALAESIARSGPAGIALLEALAAAGAPAGDAELARAVALAADGDAAAGAAAGDAAGTAAADAIPALLARRMLVRRDDGRLEPAHATLRDALLEAAGSARARALHRAWAELAAADPARAVERAGHLLAAGEVAGHEPALLAAADALERSWRPGAAIPFLEAVLAVPAAGMDAARTRLALFARLERAWHAIRNDLRAIDLCRDWAAAARALGDAAAESRAAGLLAARLRGLHRFAEAREAAGRAVELARGSGDPAALALALKILASVQLTAWDHDAALETMERALALFRDEAAAGRAGSREVAVCLNDIALLRALGGRTHAALAALDEARTAFRALGDRVWAANLHVNEALVRTFLGDLEGAAARLEQTLAEIPALGAAVPLELALENLGLIQLRLGRYEAALATGRRLLDEATRFDRGAYRVSGLLIAGEALCWTDDREAAREHDRLALALAEALGEGAQRQFARLAAARDRRLDRQLDAAREAAAAALEEAARTGNLRVQALAALERARIALDEEDAGQALEWLDRAEVALAVPREDGPATRAALLYERARARRLAGQPGLARADTEESIGLARRSGMAELELRALAVLAGLFAERGDDAAADEALAHAVALADALAARYADPARRARFLGRPDLLALRDAAVRRGAQQPAGRAAAPAGRARGLDPLGALYEVAQAVAEEGDLAPLFQRIVALAVEQAGAERGLLLLRSTDGGALEPVAAEGVEERTAHDAVRISKSVLARADEGHAILARDARSHPELSGAQSVALFDIRSVMCVPLRLGREVLGTLYVDTRGAHAAFSEADLRFLEALAAQAAVALGYGRLVGRLSLEREALRQAADAARGFGELIGRSAAMRGVFETLAKVAPTSLPVIVTGESGTGKELVARALHEASPRRAHAFLTENCAAIPETLLESVLFGHARGAFTGADAPRRGLFELADGGTLVLDEIGDMSPALQAKLLRVLQERAFRPLGSERLVRADVRVVGSTHRDLETLMRDGVFRQDLYFRLNGITVELPPLRARREDVPLLARHFLQREAKAAGLPAPPTLEPSALRALAAFDWPGNVRQLEHAMRRLLIFADGGRITRDTLAADPELAAAAGSAGARLGTGAGRDLGAGPEPGPPAAAAISEREIRDALAATGGNRKAAAARLGMPRATFYRRLKELGIG
ncbi:MAG: sigma 54-interacting transcriptional regulator [Acidobacteria bacterium]|jgi:transcriptional regulator with GAF, ATPase, and Fis domain|nr:sigma 54-interacting transcriptional regulator [Acidobacteriota bacterium]